VNLTNFDLYRYSLPLSRPLTLKGATLRRREGLLMRLSGDDGSEGWGETTPLPGFSEASFEQATVQLRRLARTLVGLQVTDYWIDQDRMLGRELERIAPAPSVRFGLELAVWNLYAASSGKSLPELVTPQPRATVPVNGLLSGPLDGVLGEVRRMRDAGYEAVKLKVGARTVAEDVRLVPHSSRNWMTLALCVSTRTGLGAMRKRPGSCAVRLASSTSRSRSPTRHGCRI
jgi:o-succinylbenzoate synthase